MKRKGSAVFDVQTIRKDFPILRRTFNGKRLIYLDNTATTQKPHHVIDALSAYYRHSNANVHRGLYALSEEATNAYEEARTNMADFIHAPARENIIFTGGTTDSINLVASSYGRSVLKSGDEILLTHMEHHSNLIPWQLIAQQTGAKLQFIPLTPDGRLDQNAMRSLITEKTKIISVTHVSNVLGTINPVNEIVKIGHRYGAVVIVDAAQSVPHMPVDVQNIECDFLAFSGHKMLGPTGIGVLYGRSDVLNRMPPYRGGGEMISEVHFDHATYKEIPAKFEAGTPNIAGAVGLSAAINYLKKIGFEAIQMHEHDLTLHALKVLEEIDGTVTYGPKPDRAGIVAFNVGVIHPHDVATLLDEDAIAVRAGHHCAQPLMRLLGVSATVRASVYFYNTREEIDILAKGLRRVKEVFNRVSS
jgi:cysteine desulfurase/selenocysteine lyase